MRGLAEPLTAEDVADAVAWAVTWPAHVNVDLVLRRSAQHKVFSRMIMRVWLFYQQHPHDHERGGRGSGCLGDSAEATLAMHGTHAIAATLRLELCGQPVRVIEIAPGMVKTGEFALTVRADQVKAGRVRQCERLMLDSWVSHSSHIAC
jgi:NADP-dependent 3-hydroxy acid dehydrogenase YdfG